MLFFFLGNVHQVIYSLLLLNTDLHVADLAYHMTRQQFLNNTMSTLVAPSRTSSSAPTPARSSSPVQSLRQDTELSRKSSIDPLNNNNNNNHNPGTSTSLDKSGPPISIQNTTLRVKRSGSVTSWKGNSSREGSRDPASGHANQTSPSGTVTENSSLNGSTVSVHDPMGRKHSPANGSVSSLPIAGQKAWEADMENYLKVCRDNCFLMKGNGIDRSKKNLVRISIMLYEIIKSYNLPVPAPADCLLGKVLVVGEAKDVQA